MMMNNIPIIQEFALANGLEYEQALSNVRSLVDHYTKEKQYTALELIEQKIKRLEDINSDVLPDHPFKMMMALLKAERDSIR